MTARTRASATRRGRRPLAGTPSPSTGRSRFVALGPIARIVSRARYVADLARLARWVEARAGRPFEIEVAAMTDPQIRRVNRRFLGHDWATDVVSFLLSSPRDPRLVGSLAVSRDTARREAARRGHSPYDEWMLYVVHGACHLLGCDDATAAARVRMRQAERAALAAIGRADVYGAALGPRGKERR